MDLTRRAHDLIRNHFDDAVKNTALDATCGNGFDTVFLADLGFKNIVGFDVQAQAIKNTQERLIEANYNNAKLINDGHENLDRYIEQPVDCVVFNFGYMPSLEHGSVTNKHITTLADSSLTALKAALTLLSKNGLISLLCYPGHPQGADETEAIRHWLNQIKTSYKVETHLARSPKTTAPVLYTIKYY